MKPGAAAPRPAAARGYQVRAVDRVVAIVEALAAGPAEQGEAGLAVQLGLHKSTVHRLLAVLARRGLVERAAGAAKYRLGSRLFELGITAASPLDFLGPARPYVARLVEITGETAHLGVLRQDAVVSMINVESRPTVRTPATVGRRIPLHCTSQGKAMLAFLPRDTAERHPHGYAFTAQARNTITSRERFLAELAHVAARGYAVDNEEFEPGLRCVAAPVRDHSGAAVASTEAMRVAAELSQALGYVPAREKRRPPAGNGSYYGNQSS